MIRRLLATAALLLVACGDDGAGTPDATVDACRGEACECTAATEDADCDAHQYCAELATGGTCVCVHGYVDGVGGCTWTGALRDPSLSLPAAWTAVGGAVVDAAAAGGVSPGEARFSPAALCALGRVEQIISMPTRAKGEPLVLALTYKNRSPGTDAALMGVSFGGGWSPFPFFGDAAYHTMRICLPEGAYAPRGTAGAGAPVAFAFGPYWEPDGCPTSTVVDFAVDHALLDLLQAGECGVAPGQGPNFDAEGLGGWTFTTNGAAVGEFAPGLGVGGSRAARIALAHRCESATMTTRIDVPDLASPALEVFVGAGPGTSGTISFGGLFTMPAFDAVAPATQTRTIHTCLPPSVRGQTMTMTMTLGVFGGTCTDELEHELYADEVRVVDDPACGNRDGFVDNGFEHPELPWGTSGVTSAGTSRPAIRSAAGQAHDGARYLALEALGFCSNAKYTMLPVVPPASGANGPALEFFAKVGVNPNAFTTVQALGERNPRPLFEGGGYMRYVACLNPRYTGRPQSVVIRHEAGNGTCGPAGYVQQDAFIDDLRLVTDPTCPAN